MYRFRPTRSMPAPALFLSIVFSAFALGPSGGVGQEMVELSGDDQALELRLELVYEIGAIDGEPWEAFQTLDDAEFAPDGTLYLLDGGTNQIVAVRDGQLRHRVGREGDGPGEYRDAWDVTVLESGNVAVWDGVKRAFLLFDPSGAGLDQFAPEFSVGVPGQALVSASGDAVVGLPSHLISGMRGAIYLTGSGYQSAAQGLPLLRVPVREDAPVEAVATVPTLQGGTVNPATRAFVPQPSWGALDGGRIALSDSDAYEVRILGVDGRHLRTLKRAIEARPTTPADERAFLRFVRERYERALRSSRGLRPVEPSNEVNAHPVIPPIQRLTTDGRGRIWVQRPDDRNPFQSGPIDILDGAGDYVGTVADLEWGLPAAFGPEGLMVFLTTDDFDVPVARVYRLPDAMR